MGVISDLIRAGVDPDLVERVCNACKEARFYRYTRLSQSALLSVALALPKRLQNRTTLYIAQLADPKFVMRRSPRRSPDFVPAHRRATRIATPRLPEKEWLVLCGQVYYRDGFRCRYCSDTDGPFAVDHVNPVSRGGSNLISNLVVACRSCNSSKCDLLLTEWRGYRGR